MYFLHPYSLRLHTYFRLSLTRVLNKFRNIKKVNILKNTRPPVSCRINRLLISRSNLQASETEHCCKSILLHYGNTCHLHDDIYLLLRPEFMARGTSSVRDYRMEAKIKTQKNPISGTTQLGYMETIKNLQIVLNTPKNTGQNFPTPKN